MLIFAFDAVDAAMLPRAACYGADAYLPRDAVALSVLPCRRLPARRCH